MFDPIGGFLRIRELYLTYLETAFRIGNEAVSKERRALLESAGALCTLPLIEPVPRYVRVANTLRELETDAGEALAGFKPEVRAAFIRLISAGLFDDSSVRLFKHQMQMLSRGTESGQPGIVTSGTGSAKRSRQRIWSLYSRRFQCVQRSQKTCFIFQAAQVEQ